jgi:hypothetical protein
MWLIKWTIGVYFSLFLILKEMYIWILIDVNNLNEFYLKIK